MGFPIPDTGAVTEDTSVIGGFLFANGDIDYFLFDDTGEWTAETIIGSYGSQLTIDADGNWTYQADNSNASIQALDTGDTLTEVFNVTSNNGASTVTITINGLDEPPCFVAGTHIETPNGPRLVEELRAGDTVITRDEGAQPIRWAGSQVLKQQSGALDAGLQPIILAPGSISPGVPDREVQVSPQHHILLRGGPAMLLFGQEEVLCAAKHLVNGSSIRRANFENVHYFHILFDRHQVVSSHSCETESFYPGQMGLAGFREEARAEVLSLFPELRSAPRAYGETARRVLKAFEGNSFTAWNHLGNSADTAPKKKPISAKSA